jgi:hypothetical protein
MERHRHNSRASTSAGRRNLCPTRPRSVREKISSMWLQVSPESSRRRPVRVVAAVQWRRLLDGFSLGREAARGSAAMLRIPGVYGSRRRDGEAR